MGCDEEGSRVGVAPGSNHLVGRWAAEFLLADLLEGLLGECLAAALTGRAHLRAEGVQDELTRGAEAAIQVDRSDHGLVQVGEDRARQRFAVQAAADPGALGEPDAFGRSGEGLPRDDLGLHLGQRAFGVAGTVPEERLGDHEIEDGVAQELHALIVAASPPVADPGGGVGECQLGQTLVLELVEGV